jgi:hypothetical protein
MIDVLPPIVRNRELIDAYARATELTDCALGLEEQRLALINRYVADLRGVLPAVKVSDSETLQPMPFFALN